MAPEEIRTLRGARSRAQFARLLGVTPLTVLRWELAEGDKEARRPRAKMIEALRRLASGDVSNLPESSDMGEDEALLSPIMDRLLTPAWPRAESELLDLLAAGSLATYAGRVLATLGVAYAQILCHFDSRNSLPTLLPILAEAEVDKLPAPLAARAFVLGAALFSAADPRVFDPGRAQTYADRAETLLPPDDHDWRVLLAMARLAGTRFLSPPVARRTYEKAIFGELAPRSPVGRLLIEGMRARVRGANAGVATSGDPALLFGDELGLKGLTLVLLTDRAWRGLRGSVAPELVLSILQQMRKKAEEYGITSGEPLLRGLACECDAYCRLGRFEEADRTLGEALAVLSRGGIPPFALAAPAARLYVYSGRGGELRELARRFDDIPTSTTSAGSVYVRALAAAQDGDFATAAELADRACAARDGAASTDFLLPDAFSAALDARIQQSDLAGAHALRTRLELLLEERPSIWHTAQLRRFEALLHVQERHTAEARQKLESSLATFTLIGDVVQAAYGRLALARAGKAFGEPDGDARLSAATEECERLGIVPRRLLNQAAVPSFPPTATAEWLGRTLHARVLVALERLSVRGLSLELLGRELDRVVRELLPDRSVRVVQSGSEPPGVWAEVLEIAGGSLRLAVGGDVDAEERAALRTLAAAAAAAFGPSPAAGTAPESDPEIEAKIPAFVAASPVTRKLKRELAQLSRSAATILITGESGSGKEVVARAVHDLSARAAHPYVPFNCASIPRDLFEGQLFGYRKGAFTGAASDNPGVIRAADGGTLFLDEIGELPLDTQPKLLRFLENAEIFPLGERKPLRVDVRVLAATHRDLGQLVRQGLFREDLYYRLNVVPLFVPPLRERREDVLALARIFIAKLAPEGTDPPELGGDALSALSAHSWPGNVRELRNVIERAMAYAPIPKILHAEHLRIGAKTQGA